MARWRAVPTAVSTAVGALAFLASTGLAIVLGAGLHVWSGPATSSGFGAHGPAAASPVTGRVGGVVTVAPPATSPRHPQPPATTGPAVVLPFVPFAPAAPSPTAVTPPASGPSAGGPGAVSAPELPGLRDLPVDRRLLRPEFRSLRLSTTGTDGLRSGTKVRRAVVEDSSGHRGHGRHHARPHPTSHRPLPHGVAVGDDQGRGHHKWSHGHGHAAVHGHQASADGRRHGHRHGHGRSQGHHHD